MENKSLNVLFPKLRVFCDHVPDKIQNVIHAVSFVFFLKQIFNSQLVLASPETASDSDYAAILGVIGHEVRRKSFVTQKLRIMFALIRDQTFNNHMNFFMLSCSISTTGLATGIFCYCSLEQACALF